MLTPDESPGAGGMNDGASSGVTCDGVSVEAGMVVEQVDEVTATFLRGEPFDMTIMLFGGEPIEHQNAISNTYVIGLDKEAALMLAESYPDFYLCNSPGGMEAQKFILDYDLVPADCEVFEQLISALTLFHRNDAAGGDRTSLRLQGEALDLQSVIVDATGEDLTDQVQSRGFYLVTSVEQLTGQSVIEFGSMP